MLATLSDIQLKINTASSLGIQALPYLCACFPFVITYLGRASETFFHESDLELLNKQCIPKCPYRMLVFGYNPKEKNVYLL